MTDPQKSPADRPEPTPAALGQQADAKPPAPDADQPAAPVALPVAATERNTAQPRKAARDEEAEYEEADVYTAEMTCKCGKKLAANAWFCPRCGRMFLINMLFALVVLATGFAILNQIVQWLLSWFSQQRR